MLISAQGETFVRVGIGASQAAKTAASVELDAQREKVWPGHMRRAADGIANLVSLWFGAPDEGPKDILNAQSVRTTRSCSVKGSRSLSAKGVRMTRSEVEATITRRYGFLSVR